MTTDLGDVDAQISVTSGLGKLYYDMGDYPQALGCLKRNLALLQDGRLYEDSTVAVHPFVQDRAYLLRCLTEIGAFAEGLSIAEEALHIAEQIDRPFERLALYTRIGVLHLRQGNSLDAIAFLERGLSLSQAVDNRMYSRLIRVYLTPAYAWSGRTPDALSWLDQIRQPQPARGTGFGMPYLGEAYLRTGRIEDGYQFTLKRLEMAQNYKAKGAQAWALWLLGEFAMHRDPPEIDQAETHYQKALSLSNELGMRPLQAHCHRGLGTLYRQTDQSEQARAELSTAIEMYREMEMTFRLPEAEAGLADVEGRS